MDFAGEIQGTPGDDVIAGNNGDNTIYGNGGEDLICTGGGTNTVHLAYLPEGGYDYTRVEVYGGPQLIGIQPSNVSP
jgi:Ca2+-binding RTX toxin-like protein